MMPPNETYAAEAESFLSELEKEYYQNGAGLKDTFDLAPIYGRYAHLFSADRVRNILASRRSKEDRFLAQFAASQYLERSVCALTDEITTAETQATLSWDDAEIPYRAGLALVLEEADRNRRRELIHRVHAITSQLDGARSARVAKLHQSAKLLGFETYTDLCDELLGIRVEWLATQMDGLLGETERIWEQDLSGYLSDRGLHPDTAHVTDLRHILRAPHFDAFFPKEQLLAVATTTLKGMGIDVRSLANLKIDTAQRKLKSPRSFCCRVHVPSDIRLVLMPRGGREDYMMLFHETGHALHFAYADPAAPFAFRYLGDNSVTECYAFLLQLLVGNPAWLREALGVIADDSYRRLARFFQIYYLRRIGARLAYELELHALDAPTDDLPARYAERLGQALKVQISPEEYLSDVDDSFYSACYLRAWILEVQLRLKLIEEFGEAWFTRSEAGDFLRGLWAHGQEFTAEEIARKLGYPGLQVEPLIADLTSPVEA